MALSVWGNEMPTLGISEAFRYLPCVAAGVMIILFSIEHLIAMFNRQGSDPIMALTYSLYQFYPYSCCSGVPVAFSIALQLYRDLLGSKASRWNSHSRT
jgi:hypothetical protein